MHRFTPLLSLSIAALCCCVSCDRGGDRAEALSPGGLESSDGEVGQHAGGGEKERHGESGGSRRGDDGEVAVTAEDSARLGDGFVVWESRRSGAWRIWRRDLDGSGLVRLSPDESGRDHCCAHVSPDGEHVVYLSLPGGAGNYGADDEGGPLHLMRADGSDDRVLEPAARTYGWGHRAAIWHDQKRLVFIDRSGATVRADLESGAREVLAEKGDQGRGWLIGASLEAATSGRPSFSVYDAGRKAVLGRSPMGGCEAYFTADGRWGYWIAGAGGPLNRFDLVTRASATMLSKNDPRLPSRQGYMYFPMVSPDGHLLAVGASNGEHDHQTADYDIFVSVLDPDRLEVVGEAVRITDEPGADRYPSPFATPLPLGRFQGEAPLDVELAAPPGKGAWSWDFGDGARVEAPRAKHAYAEPGVYEVVARQADRRVMGRVTVLPARAPRAVAVALRGGGRELVVSFDEPVDVTRARATLQSGAAIERAVAGSDGRTLVLHLARALAGSDRLQLEGAADRAQRPNPMAPASLEVDASRWPSDTAGLVFRWERGDQPNTVWDAAAGAERSYAVEPQGRARLDHDFAMLLADGAFVAAEEAAAVVARAARAKNEISLELVLEPGADDERAQGVLAWSGKRRGQPNFALEQRGAELLLTLRRSAEGDPAPVEFGRLTAGRRSHLVVSYTPGWLIVLLDGEAVLETDAVQGDFFPWAPGPLAFGAAGDGSRQWSGTLEGIAIYDRALGVGEAQENARRYRAAIAARPAIGAVRVEVRRLRASTPPDLRQIAPYRQALVVHEYEVVRAVGGSAPAGRIRVAHWAILDGETQPVAGAEAGERLVLDLEPYQENRQLEGLVMADTLGAESVPLFLDVRP